MPLHELKKKLTGTYILIVRFQKKKEINVGKVGAFSFRSGYYLYVGSAFGPGGLNSRIKRHLLHTKKHHWHIDYLTTEETVDDIWFSSHGKKIECMWATILERTPELQHPVPGFGSSDCTCRSHLFYSKKKPFFSHYCNLLGRGIAKWISPVSRP